jgi:hypothetical protein
MSFLSPALYTKNLPTWERVARVAASVAALVAAAFLARPWNWIVAASAVSFALSGLFGFCLACAMVGRRLESSTK